MNIPSGTPIAMAMDMAINTSSKCASVASKISARCVKKNVQGLKPKLPEPFARKR